METSKQKQTRNKQRKRDMFDLAIPVDIFVQRKIVIGAHTQKRSDKTTFNIYMSKNCDDAIDPSFEIEINYLAFHALSYLLQNFDPRNKTCT